MDHRSHIAECRARLEKKMIEDEKLKQTIYRRDARVKRNKHQDMTETLPEEAPQAPAEEVDDDEPPLMHESDDDDTPKHTEDS